MVGGVCVGVQGCRGTGLWGYRAVGVWVGTWRLPSPLAALLGGQLSHSRCQHPCDNAAGPRHTGPMHTGPIYTGPVHADLPPFVGSRSPSDTPFIHLETPASRFTPSLPLFSQLTLNPCLSQSQQLTLNPVPESKLSSVRSTEDWMAEVS